MAFTPISNTVPQYEENGVAASGYFIKFYESGTTTPTAMATDSTGTTLLDKCELNTEGYPINGSNAVFIPHINKKYKIALFRNAADADANDLASAAWPAVDGLLPVLSEGDGQIDTIANLRLLKPSFDGQQVDLLGHTLAGIGGGTFYYDAPDTTSTDNNGTVIVTSSGERWKRKLEGFATPEMFGCVGDNATPDLVNLQIAVDNSTSLLLLSKYSINGRLNITNKKGFKIFSNDKSNGLFQTTADIATYISGAGSEGVTLENFTVDGGGVGQENIGVVAIENCIDFDIGGLEVRNTGRSVNGISVSQQGASGVIHDCHVHDTGKAGIYSATYTESVVIRDNIVHDITNNQYGSPYDVMGIQIIGGINTKVENNLTYNCSGAGVYAMTGDNYPSLPDVPYNLLISGNTCRNNKRGIYLLDPTGTRTDGSKDTRASISFNYCYENSVDGIFCDGRDNITLFNNWCYSNFTGTSGLGIYVRGGSNITLLNNHCFDNYYSGIQLNDCSKLNVSFNFASQRYGTQIRGITFSGVACDEVKVIANNTASIVQFVAPTNLKSVLNTPNTIDETFIDVAGSLPSASAERRGQLIIVAGGTGTADKSYICGKDAGGSYGWNEISYI